MKYELFFLFFLMFGVVVTVSYLSPSVPKTEHLVTSTTLDDRVLPVSFPQPQAQEQMTTSRMRKLFQQDQELFQMLLNGAVIVQGPSKPSAQERAALPAIYHQLPEEGLYKAELKYQNHQWLILFNTTTILKKVVISQIRLG